MGVSWYTTIGCQAGPGRAAEVLEEGDLDSSLAGPSQPDSPSSVPQEGVSLPTSSQVAPAGFSCSPPVPQKCVHRLLKVTWPKGPRDEGSDPSRGSSAPEALRFSAPLGCKVFATCRCLSSSILPSSQPSCLPPVSPENFMPAVKNQMQSSWFSFKTDSSFRVSPSF